MSAKTSEFDMGMGEFFDMALGCLGISAWDGMFHTADWPVIFVAFLGDSGGLPYEPPATMGLGWLGHLCVLW
jgi:hypothetical protein